MRNPGYASAGHPSGYVVGPSGEVTAVLASTGVPLGILTDADFPLGAAVTLGPGDRVLLLTDGVLEARSPGGDPFGAERAVELARLYRGDPAGRLVGNLYHAVRAFARNQPQHDDITAVVLRGEPAD